MSTLCCVTAKKYYIVIPCALFTETIGQTVIALGVTPHKFSYINMEGELVITDYTLIGLNRPYLDCLQGFYKFTADEIHGILAKIKSDTIQLSDVYLSH